jgi:hypothetical protein
MTDVKQAIFDAYATKKALNPSLEPKLLKPKPHIQMTDAKRALFDGDATQEALKPYPDS